MSLPPPLSDTMRQLITNKGNELKAIIYPGLSDSEINALWDSFGNANPTIRDGFIINRDRLFSENPAETEENAEFILTASLQWLVEAARNIQGIPIRGGKKKKYRTTRKKISS